MDFQDGSNVMTQICTLSNPNSPIKVLFGDFNGDGMTDIFSSDRSNNWTLSISKGMDLISKTISTFNGFDQGAPSINNFYANDMNGDGKSDIVIVGKATSTFKFLLGFM